MFANFFDDTLINKVEIKKEIKAETSWKDASYFGAFSIDDKLRISMRLPRGLGAYGVVLRINKDGEDYRDMPLSFADIEGSFEVYSIELDMRELCLPDSSALFFYEFLILRGEKTLFTNSINNKDFELLYHSYCKFSLLVYSSDYHAKEWFGKGIMYHIFVDRFAKGEIKPFSRDDIEINEDWEHGIPQYAKVQGERLENNMFFGGNLKGISDKMDYIESLGTKVIYLSPVFKAYSNHKYDTGDYGEIDEMFGGEEAFCELIETANKRGIKIILDGVFNHTGDNSRYFNKYGNYDSAGAYNDENSPYRSWYNFKRFPDDYDSWWGIDILPKLNQYNDQCREYFVGKNGIIEKYTKMGIGGWRLDVADELPDVFLDELRSRAHESSCDQAIIIGEVWENAATKVAYDHRRRYFQGKQLDSVMNYPIRNGILDFIKSGNARMLYNVLTEIYASYPRFVSDSLMNILGTHDTERILTVLGEKYCPQCSNDELAVKTMDDDERSRAIQMLKMAASIQYTVYGIPSVFYGDEAGSEGYHDPFCRKPYPWGRENAELLEHYKRLGKIRIEEKALDRGDFKIISCEESVIAYERSKGNSRVLVCANRSSGGYILKADGKWQDLLTDDIFENEIIVNKDTARILKLVP